MNPGPQGAVGAIPVADFLALSAPLTGFEVVELEATGMADTYLDKLRAIVGDHLTARLLSVGGAAAAWSEDHVHDELRRRVMGDKTLGPLAANVVVLWYLGQWRQLPAEWRDRHGASVLDVDHIVSAEAYKAGLVWTAIGAHPQGANPQGFGSWAAPPPDLHEVSIRG